MAGEKRIIIFRTSNPPTCFNPFNFNEEKGDYPNVVVHKLIAERDSYWAHNIKQSEFLGNQHFKIKELEAKLVEKEAIIVQKDATIAEKDAFIVGNNLLLAQKEAIIANKDAQIAEQVELIAIYESGALLEPNEVGVPVQAAPNPIEEEEDPEEDPEIQGDDEDMKDGELDSYDPMLNPGDTIYVGSSDDDEDFS